MTAGVDPQWRLDRVALAQMYPSDAAIMRRAMELTLAALPRGQGCGSRIFEAVEILDIDNGCEHP